MSAKTLGEDAFDAYNLSRGGVNFMGNKTPAWKDLPPEIRAAWQASASAVVRRCRENTVLKSSGQVGQ